MSPRVAVGIPSTGDWKAGFGRSLAHMCLVTESVARGDLLIVSQLGSALSIQRTRVVKAAQEFEATHLLFIDSDMVFPSTLIDDLLAHDVDVVAANCPVKSVPSHSTARVWRNDRWELVLSEKETHGLERVDRVGTGVMLLKMSVFERAKQPWFAFLWEGPEGEYTGEDWCLCEKLEEAGIDIYVDHDVSKKIGHIGNLTYTHNMVKPEYLQHPGGKDYRRWKDRGVDYLGG
jgi:hypothetical protein